MDDRLQALLDDFAFLDGWEERYAQVIDMGKALPQLAEAARTDAALVPGCASQVWLLCSLAPETGHVRLYGASDAIIVQGLLAILLALYDDRPPHEILALDAKQAIDALGFSGALTPQRSNGLFSMAQRIKNFALESVGNAL